MKCDNQAGGSSKGGALLKVKVDVVLVVGVADVMVGPEGCL